MSLIDEFKAAREAGNGGDSEHTEFCFWLDENSERIEKALEAGRALINSCYRSEQVNEGRIGWSVKDLEKALE